MEGISDCWVEDSIIGLQEGRPCKLPEEEEYTRLCALIFNTQPTVSNLSLALSQNLGLLPRGKQIQARLSCDPERGIIWFRSKGVTSPSGMFVFKTDKINFIFIIYPKIFTNDPRGGMKALLYMIEKVLASSLAAPRTYLTELSIGSENFLEDWMRLIYFLYSRMLLRELLKGAYYEYVRFIIASPRVSGKVLVSAQARKPLFRKLEIIQENYLYSIDNTLNRVLKYAAHIAYRNLIRVEGISGAARQILAIFSDVKLDPSSIWERVEFNRLNARFEYLYHIALLIILARGVSGDRTLSGLLIDMNELFELYIYSILKNWLKDWQVKYQVNLDFIRLYNKTYTLGVINRKQRIDLLLRSPLNDRCIVLEIKYSQIDAPQDVFIDDLRQIFTYHILLENLPEGGCTNVSVYSAILYLARDEEYEKDLESICGAYRTVAHQNKFKIILLSPKLILKAADNFYYSYNIEKKIIEQIINFTNC